MRIHILGICGTFMGGLALLARELGHEVSGSDRNVYPPMSSQLERAGISLQEGYEPAHLQPAPDLVLVGNALSRGNPAVEHCLAAGIPYTSGPQWLGGEVLRHRQVIAISGTHGKTTTSAIAAWLLEHSGVHCGFLIGGAPGNFPLSARLGRDAPFVIEADEYDTAFFDKRPKFLHYRPGTLVINNIEFDHADIYDDLAAIQRQFALLLRSVPGNGRILAPHGDATVDLVLAKGCWSPVETFGLDENASWHGRCLTEDGTRFDLHHAQRHLGTVTWSMLGAHNVRNAIAAVAAVAPHLPPGHDPSPALAEFSGVKRRMELRGEARGVGVFDDFAHHPTAIRVTLEGLRAHRQQGRILVVFEPRSNTMRLGVHNDHLAQALSPADAVLVYAPPDLAWDPSQALASLGAKCRCHTSLDGLVQEATGMAQTGDALLVMSNGGFGGIHQRLLDALGSP